MTDDETTLRRVRAAAKAKFTRKVKLFHERLKQGDPPDVLESIYDEIVNQVHELEVREKVRDHEVLWNIRHPHYPKKTMKRRIFEEIRNQLIQTHPEMASLTADDLFGKLSYLHGNFRRVLHKVRNTPSGSGGKPEPKWEYFKACSFLLPVYDNHSFQSSLELPPREDVVYEGTLEDLVQLDFSPLYSPRSIGISHPSSAASTSLSIDAPCTPPESQTPSPQGPVDTAKLQAVVLLSQSQQIHLVTEGHSRERSGSAHCSLAKNEAGSKEGKREDGEEPQGELSTGQGELRYTVGPGKAAGVLPSMIT
ncbi:hypothetical protein O3P69_014699 [Scylla paramamosain]|uniref:MADF domain-containing protein n=1 Tax=Scylla paramamosain TaxID=85552 RepID=A0AAW0TXM1_SCYPA